MSRTLIITICCLVHCFGYATARTGPLGPMNNYEAPAGVQIGTVSTDLSCTVSLLGLLPITQSSINLKLGGALTTTVARSQGFYLNGRAIITIPANLTTLLATVGVQSISGNASSVILEAAGSQDGQYDIAKYADLAIPNTAITSGKDLVITIPAAFQLAAGLMLGWLQSVNGYLKSVPSAANTN